MRNFKTVFSSSSAGVSPVQPLELSLKNLKTWGLHPRPRDMTIAFLFKDLISNKAENVSHTHTQRTVRVLAEYSNGHNNNSSFHRVIHLFRTDMKDKHRLPTHTYIRTHLLNINC